MNYGRGIMDLRDWPDIDFRGAISNRLENIFLIGEGYHA